MVCPVRRDYRWARAAGPGRICLIRRNRIRGFRRLFRRERDCCSVACNCAAHRGVAPASLGSSIAQVDPMVANSLRSHSKLAAILRSALLVRICVGGTHASGLRSSSIPPVEAHKVPALGMLNLVFHCVFRSCGSNTPLWWKYTMLAALRIGLVRFQPIDATHWLNRSTGVS